MIQTQVVLLLYGLSGRENWPLLLCKCLLHFPKGRVTGEGVATFTGSLLTDDVRNSNRMIYTLIDTMHSNQLTALIFVK